MRQGLSYVVRAHGVLWIACLFCLTVCEQARQVHTVQCAMPHENHGTILHAACHLQCTWLVVRTGVQIAKQLQQHDALLGIFCGCL